MTDNIKKQRRYTPEERKHHLVSWRDSGLTMSEYCREHDLSISSLSLWNKSQEKTKPKDLREISATPAATGTIRCKQLPVEVVIPNGIKIRISNIDQLPSVLAILQREC